MTGDAPTARRPTTESSRATGGPNARKGARRASRSTAGSTLTSLSASRRPKRSVGSSSCSTPRRPDTREPSTRSPPVCCRSPSARRRRLFRSSRTAPRPIVSGCAGAKRARPTMQRARLSRAPTTVRPRPRSKPSCRASSASSSRRPRPFPRSRSMAHAPTISPGIGESFVIPPRPIAVYRLELMSADVHSAVFEAECGKGAYVRAIARDLGRALGCYGHVVELRRTRVGPFDASAAIPLRPVAGRRRTDGARHVAAAGWPRRTPVAAGRSERRCDPAARTTASAARRPSARRPGLGGLLRNADRFRRHPGRLFRVGAGLQHKRIAGHFQASKALVSIASPSEDFWNTSLAMRLSSSSSGKSNQARVCIRSRLRAVS